MRSFAILTGLVAVALAATPVKRDEECAGTPCMTDVQATKVANNFASLISNYSNASANAYLTIDFTDYSDSVIELIDGGCTAPLPLGQPTFSGRAAFEAGQGSQANIEFNILQIWHTCDTVALRWETPTASGAPENVRGIIVLETEYSSNTTEPFLIQTTYSEFNSGAWLVDLGKFVPTCSSASKRSLDHMPARLL